MPLMGFASLSDKLGERILDAMGIKYERILGVDFTVDWFNGSEATPGDTQYPVEVSYLRAEVVAGLPNQLVVTKSYDSMSEIINELSDIEDDLRFD